MLRAMQMMEVWLVTFQRSVWESFNASQSIKSYGFMKPHSLSGFQGFEPWSSCLLNKHLFWAISWSKYLPGVVARTFNPLLGRGRQSSRPARGKSETCQRGGKKTDLAWQHVTHSRIGWGRRIWSSGSFSATQWSLRPTWTTWDPVL